MAPTTAYVEFTSAVRDIGARTTSAGVAAADLSAEEDRLINAILSEGALSDGAFIVAAGSGMNVTIGSGVSKADLYAVAGDVAGQGTYIARLDATSATVAASAADPALDRTDEIWLVVADAPYDAGSVSLPRIGYRKGDAGGADPGPDTAWKAAAKLASFVVPAAATASSQFTITDTRTFAQIAVGAPTGKVDAFAGSTAPTGWLLCDGSSLLRATYPRLFSVIGTTYGAADGTHFNVPDCRGRFLIGVKAADGDFDALGETGGAKTKTLAEANMPAHTHTGPAHTHTVFDEHVLLQAVSGVLEASAVQSTSGGDNQTTSSSGTGATGSTGSGTAFDVMNPYLALNFIIKT